MGPSAGGDGCGKSRPPIGIRSTDRPARSESFVPTELSRPTHASGRKRKCVVDEALTATGFSNSREVLSFMRWSLLDGSKRTSSKSLR